jgi:hypothetical protein
MNAKETILQIRRGLGLTDEWKAKTDGGSIRLQKILPNGDIITFGWGLFQVSNGFYLNAGTCEIKVLKVDAILTKYLKKFNINEASYTICHGNDKFLQYGQLISQPSDVENLIQQLKSELLEIFFPWFEECSSIEAINHKLVSIEHLDKVSNFIGLNPDLQVLVIKGLAKSDDFEQYAQKNKSTYEEYSIGTYSRIFMPRKLMFQDLYSELKSTQI